MKKKFYVNELKSIVLGVFGAVLVGSSIGMIIIGRAGSAAVFLSLAAIILVWAAYNGAVISLDSQGITRTTLFFIKQTKPWSEIAEMGVCGTKVFHPISKKRTGTIYFYTSSKKLSDDDCFQMILHWPPKKEFVFKYCSDALVCVQYYYESKIRTYNTGDLRLEEKRKT